MKEDPKDLEMIEAIARCLERCDGLAVSIKPPTGRYRFNAYYVLAEIKKLQKKPVPLMYMKSTNGGFTHYRLETLMGKFLTKEALQKHLDDYAIKLSPVDLAEFLKEVKS